MTEPTMWDAKNEPLPGMGGAPTGKGPDCEHGESGLRGDNHRESAPSKVTAAGRPSPELQDLHDTAVVVLFDHAELLGFKDSAWTWVVECPCDVWYYKRNK